MGSSAQEERTLIAIAEPAGARDVMEAGLSSQPFVFKAEVTEVQIRFLALDRKGQPAAPLQLKDIQVVTDGKDSPAIKSFVQLHSAPITLGILIDLSESIRPEMQLQELAFSEGVSGVLQPARDREFLVAFSSNVSLLQGPTSDFGRVKDALKRSPGSQNLTSLYDAIVRTCQEQFGPVHPGIEERRILTLFSDGVDNLSIHSLDDAVDAAIEAGVDIFAVAPENGDPRGQAILKMLADRTGGQLELLRNKQLPEQSVASVQALIGGEYALSFRPLNDRPGAHSVELKADLPVVLHARKNFYVCTPRP